MADDLSPQDLDMIARTVVGEAGNQSALGQAAVAHVVMNRLKSGQWGDTPSDVVLAPKQFEAWGNRPQELATLSRTSPTYRSALAIAKQVASGDIPDPTNGALNFANVDTIQKRGNQSAMNWINGMSNVTKIGDHTFGNAEGQQAINKAAHIQPQQSGNALALNDSDIQDTMKLFGLKSKSKAASAPDNQDADIQETMKAFGIKPTDKSAAETTPLPTPRPASAPQTAEQSPMRGGVNLQNQIVSGMPIISPLFDRAVAASGAAISPLLPNSDKRPASFGERYSKNLDDIRGENKQYAEENPIKSTLANLAGGGMALGPIAATNAGRIALGIEGPTLGSRIAQGVAGGTALAGTDAALRGESPVEGGLIGAIAGAAGPVISSAVRGGTGFVANHLWPKQGPLKDIGGIALNKIVGGLEGETPASIAAGRERMGSAGFLADVNPGLTDIAGGIADTTGGPGKGLVREAYRTRVAQQGDRIDQALTDATGQQKGNIEDFKNFLTETRKAAADPLYEEWRNSSIHPTDKLKSLIPRLEQSGAFDQAEKLSGISGEPINKSFFTTGPQKEYPTAQSWDYVKRGLDSKIDQAYSAGDKTTGRALVGLKNEMIDEIEKTPAGQIWKQARSEFADRSAILDQIEAGRDTFLGGRSGLSSDELKDELKGLKGPELAARITGMRNAAGEAMGSTVNGDTTFRNKMLAPNNQEKIKLLIGDDRGGDLIKSMKQEKFLSEQDQNIRGGSQTTPKKDRVDALKAPQTPEWNPNLTQPLSLIPPHILEQLRPSNIADAWRGRAYGRAHEQLAPLLTTPEGPQLQDLIAALQAESARRGAIANRSNRTGNALSALVAIPGSTTARRQAFPSQ